jgi:putative ATP-dependent endonuclease of the OLD family
LKMYFWPDTVHCSARAGCTGGESRLKMFHHPRRGPFPRGTVQEAHGRSKIGFAEMKIDEICIHNFRSIADERLRLGSYSLLIGANNSGKSNLIDALRTFYDKDIKFEAERDFPKFPTSDKESWIEIQFLLSADETATIKEEYLIKKNRCRVRKWLFPPEKAKQGLIGYEHGTLSENMFYGWKNVGQAKLGNIIYIPAASRLEEQTKLTGPSPLRDLVNDILKSIVESSAAFDSLRQEFKSFESAIKVEETTDKRSLKGLETEINTQIIQWGAIFNLEVTSPKIDDIMKSLFTHNITDSELNTNLQSVSFGHGFQRHLVFTLIRISASYVAPATEPKKKEFSPDFELLLFEEPEAFLHPPQQDVLDTHLRHLSEKSGRQVLAATHSPHFVSYNTDDIADLIRVSRVNGRTEICQIERGKLTEIFKDDLRLRVILDELKNVSEGPILTLEYEAALEAVRHFLWLNPERCGLFFADCVLIVEGLSEQVLVNYLLKTGKLNVGAKWVFVLEAWGKFNVHRFMNLLGSMKIKHAVLFDHYIGEESAKKRQQQGVEKLIRDCANSSTVGIDSMPDSLESFLGLTTEKEERWKKAAKNLLTVKEGRADKEKLDAFVKKVEKLLVGAL